MLLFVTQNNMGPSLPEKLGNPPDCSVEDLGTRVGQAQGFAAGNGRHAGQLGGRSSPACANRTKQETQHAADPIFVDSMAEVFSQTKHEKL